jgi:hypothetical protein
MYERVELETGPNYSRCTAEFGIAKVVKSVADGSKSLVIFPGGGSMSHRTFPDLPLLSVLRMDIFSLSHRSDFIGVLQNDYDEVILIVDEGMDTDTQEFITTEDFLFSEVGREGMIQRGRVNAGFIDIDAVEKAY